MTELEAQSLLETLQASPGRAEGSSLKQLSNGDFVIVTAEQIYLWNEQDTRKFLKGSLKALKLSRKEQEAVT
jgi:hypothetical protein